MNSDAFLRGFFEKIAVQFSEMMGSLHTKEPGREIFAPKRSEFAESDPQVAARASLLRKRGVRGKIPTGKGLSSFEEMSQMFPRRR